MLRMRRSGSGPKFGMSEKEIEQINRHKLALIHLGNVKSHVTIQGQGHTHGS